MKDFDNANITRPEFIVEQGGVTASIYREIFMSVRGDAKSIQTEPKPNQNRTEKLYYRIDKGKSDNNEG